MARNPAGHSGSILTFPLFGWSVFILSVVRRPPGSWRQAADPLKEIPGARVPLALAGANAKL